MPLRTGLLACIALLMPGLVHAEAPPARTAAAHNQVIAYLFLRDGVLQPGQVDADKLTRVNYAFANVADGKVVEGFAHDADNFAALRALRQSHPGLQVLVSVGGWTWSKNFSDVALTGESRQRFAASAADFVTRYDLDGIDIDWEYPGQAGDNNPHRPEDRENYTRLLQELRVQLDALAKRTHRRMFLSVATTGTPEFLAHTEMAAVARIVDSVNLMAYDMAVEAKTTAHNAPLYANPLGPAGVSADDNVKATLRAGVPAAKIVLGVPFYGKGWTDVGPEQNGLFQPGLPAANMRLTYAAIATDLLPAGSGYQRFWDKAAEVPYLYNTSTKTWVDYEDPESIGKKARYVRSNGLGGMMFWEYSQDLNGALTGAIHTGLNANER